MAWEPNASNNIALCNSSKGKESVLLCEMMPDEGELSDKGLWESISNLKNNTAT